MKRARWVFGLIVLATVLLTGCATSYHAAGVSGNGYGETRLGESTFVVHFDGNSWTSQQQATDYALLRAAELSQQHGYAYFVITESNTAFDTNTFATREGLANSDAPRVSLRITAYREEPKNVNELLNAQFVEQSIRLKYGL